MTLTIQEARYFTYRSLKDLLFEMKDYVGHYAVPEGIHAPRHQISFKSIRLASYSQRETTLSRGVGQ